MLTHLAVLCFFAATPSQMIFVDPKLGSDASIGSIDAPLRSLAAAKTAVRKYLKTNADIQVQLLPGRHMVEEGGLSLGVLDGGQGVVWQSFDEHDPAIIDGGTLISGWTKSTMIKDALVAPVNFMNATNLTLRQLWVNGLRAERPVLYAINQDGRWPSSAPGGACCPEACRNREAPYYPCPTCNCTVTNTTDGFDFTHTTLANKFLPEFWANPGDVEFVFHFPGQWTPWIEPRCTVRNVTGKYVNLKQPCFSDLAQRNLGPSKHQLRPTPPPAYIENVLSNLTAPGQWYFDRAGSQVFYIPRPGEYL
jgi:hypothetical protein